MTVQAQIGASPAVRKDDPPVAIVAQLPPDEKARIDAVVRQNMNEADQATCVIPTGPSA